MTSFKVIMDDCVSDPSGHNFNKKLQQAREMCTVIDLISVIILVKWTVSLSDIMVI